MQGWLGELELLVACGQYSSECSPVVTLREVSVVK